MATSPTFKKLAETATVPWIKEVYKLVAEKSPRKGDFVADSSTKPISHTTDEIKKIKTIQYEAVKAARVADGQNLITPTGFIEGLQRNFVKDSFWNPMSGIGSYDDPGMYSYAYTPVSMSPQEATAYYSSGGIPKVIIDKKSKGIMTNGYTFDGEGWTPDEIKRLHDYAELLGFGEAQTNSTRDGLIYGGAVMYPRLKHDNVASLEWEVDALVKAGILTKDSIDHFVTTDRWNCVLVPNWNVTARDYIHPSHYYIPIGGVKVATNRSAIIRPNQLPYWGMLPQMGWGISDFEGYIAPILAYMMLVMSIPIMAQQMSLLFHEIPIDAVITMNGAGPDSPTAELLAHNDEVMRKWSMLHPTTVNSFGKISAIERHYEGFKDLVTTLIDDIGARSEIPSSVLFPSAPTGLASDRGDEVKLKESSAIQKVGTSVKPQLKPVVRMLALSCFGPEYFTGDRARLLDTIGVCYDSPTVQTPTEKAEVGSKFAEMVGKFVQADMPVDVALDLSKQFFPGIEIPDEIMARLREIPGGTPEGWDAAELGGVMQQGQLVEKLMNPTGYLGLGGNGNGQKLLTQDQAPGLKVSMDDVGAKLHAGVKTLGDRISSVETAVHDLANRPAPRIPDPAPIRVEVPVNLTVKQVPMKTTFTGERDRDGNLRLETIVKTEEPVEGKE